MSLGTTVLGTGGSFTRVVVASFAALLIGGIPIQATAHTEPVCDRGACGLYADQAYPNLVVGTVERVLSPEESARLFGLARERGAWSALPDRPDAFASLVRGIVISTHDRAATAAPPLMLTVFMTEDEYRADPFGAGVLVRYAPHGIDHERPPQDKPELLPYWDVTGCVLVMCGVQTPNCTRLFLPGVYERRTGRTADWRTGQPVSAHPLIDPKSRLNLHPPPS